MLGPNPFFKAPIDYTYNAKMPPKQIWTGKDEMMKVRQAYLEESKQAHNNNAARQLIGDGRFGFKTMLTGSSKPLPTAPAIVGGNVDWTQKAVGPTTMFFHHEMMNKRQMLPPPALGAQMFVKEPDQNSIHTNI